jgi:rare lipoprotein A
MLITVHPSFLSVIQKPEEPVVVRVNDRGPFTEGMSLDLSAGAARAIGMRSTQKVSMKRC